MGLLLWFLEDQGYGGPRRALLDGDLELCIVAVLYVVPGTGLSLMVRETSIYQFAGREGGGRYAERRGSYGVG